MPASRERASPLAVTSGSPPGFALVITSTSPCGARSHPVPAGRPAASWNSRYWSGVYGSIAPSHASPGATPGSAPSAAALLRSSTIGRSQDSSHARSLALTSASGASDAAPATITANGFSSRALRSRSRATDSALRASHARWNPPRPLIATISPRAMRASAAAMGSTPGSSVPSAASNASRGPQAGQAFGSAWKRRSYGEAYSLAQDGHCTNAAMLVVARSYGR